MKNQIRNLSNSSACRFVLTMGIVDLFGDMANSGGASMKKKKNNKIRKALLLIFIIILLSFLAIYSIKPTPQPQETTQQSTPIPLQTSKLSSCSFVRSDQQDPQFCNHNSCTSALPYKSTKLISYFEEVSQKTSIPAELLAAIARIESTTKDFTISDYTDEQITAMEDVEKIKENIDTMVDSGKKAACPRSITGALGLMQMQPPEHIHNAIREELLNRYNREQMLPLFAIENDAYNREAAIRSYEQINAHDEEAMLHGAAFAGIDRPLKREDFCHPKTNLYLASGLILKKMQRLGYGDSTKWNPTWSNDKQAIEALITSYYGCLQYPNCNTGPYSYSDDVYKGIQSCKG